MKKRALLFIIIAGIFWGTSVLFASFLRPLGFSSLQLTFFRAVISFISLSVFAVIKNREAFKISLKDALLFFAIGFSFFGTASAYYIAMEKTTAATAVVLMYLAPIYVLIYSVLFLGEKLNLIKIISIIGMIVGCALVSGIIGGVVLNPLGIFMGILAGVAYAAYNVFTKIGTKRGSNALSMTIYCFMFASIVAFFVCSPMELPRLLFDNEPITIPAVILFGACTCVIPYFLYTLAMKDLPAGTATALGILEPLSATVFGVMLGDELGLYSIIGIVLILSAVVLLSRGEE